MGDDGRTAGTRRGGASGRCVARVATDGKWDAGLLARVMSGEGMRLVAQSGDRSRWAKVADDSEAYPLMVDVAIAGGDEPHVAVRGYVLDDDRRTRLTLDGDDGATHHAKSVALEDFDALCEALRSAAAGTGDATDAGEQPEAAAPSQATAAPQASQVPWQQVPGQQQLAYAPQAIPQTMGQAPYQAQQQAMYPQQAPYQQQMRQQAPYPQQPATAQFGYGTSGMQAQQGGGGIAPGWAIEDVPDKRWPFVALSCTLLLLLVAESFFTTSPFLNIVIAMFMAWPAIPAIILSLSYKKAFEAGNAQLAMAKMRQAKGWIVASAILCVVRIMLKLVMCAGWY